MNNPWIVQASRAAALGVVYVAAARLGLALDAVSGFATLVWPPSGLSLAALLLFGQRLWPGVFAGAVVANLLAGAPLPVAVGIGMGNTLEAVLGAWLLVRVRFSLDFDHIRDVISLVVLAAALSTLVAATVGVGSLWAGGIIDPSQAGQTWRAWWVGDLIGDLLVTPLLLVVFRAPWSQLLGNRRRVLEAVALGALGLGMGAVTFMRQFDGPAAMAPTYMLFPVLIWAALRFGQLGATTAVFGSSVLAIWGTVLGRGPFVRPQLYDALLALQLFMGIAAVTFLVLAAAMAELRAAELAAREAHAQAETANRAKADFLAVMSHELRTPLNAIYGYVELLTMGVKGPLNDGQRDALARVQRNQQHLRILIEDVLSFARIEAGKLEIRPGVVSVTEAIDAVEPLVEQEMRSKHVHFERRLADDEIHVTADSEKLRQILANFLSNATKFTKDGGLIAVGASRENGLVRIWVEDSGIGIPPEQIQRVFDPFFQVEHGMTRRYSGVGLGLTIARDLARAMNGDVQLESVLGTGTKVSLLLPPAAPAQ